MNTTKIISFVNQKGGVGKTSSTASVGSILAHKMGYKVLLIDLDSQANLTASLLNQEPDTTIYEALTGRSDLPILPISDHLFIVPASEMLSMIDIELAAAISREKILDGLLEDVKNQYDFILIDCPTWLGIATLNALTASTDVIIPLVAEVLPFNGLKMMNKIIHLVHARLNKAVHLTGILFTRWENTNLSKAIETDLRNAVGEIVFQTKIRKNVSIAEAPVKRLNIVEYAPRSNGAHDYARFTEELLSRLFPSPE